MSSVADLPTAKQRKEAGVELAGVLGVAPPPFMLSARDAVRVADVHGTPTYVYDEGTLHAAVCELRTAFGADASDARTPRTRFAVKACPTRAVLLSLADVGMDFDAGSVFEARRVIAAGVAAHRVQVTAQQLHEDDGHGGVRDLLRRGCTLTACSVRQLEQLAAAAAAAAAGDDVAPRIGVRINPGEGSGHNKRTAVAGPNASFGVWHEQLPAFVARAAQLGVKLTYAHHHVGSGGAPEKWLSMAEHLLSLVDKWLPDVTTVNLGGGFPVARVRGDSAGDVRAAASGARRLLAEFEQRTGRRLRLEVEPGSFIVANAGVLVATVEDVVTTSAATPFVKIDAGMSHIMRPALYGALHPIAFVHRREPMAVSACEMSLVGGDGGGGAAACGGEHKLVVVGPCCESGDQFTPVEGDAEEIQPRAFARVPVIGDVCLVGAAGAYCSAMAAHNYNSLPAAAECLRSASAPHALR
eukprot:CAMPEP_0198322142 /NCGR_PEP_ID=MMETSP1450-20131203/10688_1 /TAXON_ID=753684 ORGANISM="Madagascaria erythrocladiodes, Strain CCMP3234" /NCGR_SAMPLE_ID=MMETSP1450 /ASSEMBLY_ACC=CAM_ASM_001115 /LENGTH=468 /DNA_ID=CAMNT_0044025743 /DNA_START=118 /DNA_END=1520 /DNA_ORIENTATION=-